MYWQILPHASACIASKRVFLLDVRQDRYLAVPASLTRVVEDWLLRQDKGSAPNSFIDLLQRSGTLLPDDTAPRNTDAASVTVPNALTVCQATEPASPITIVRVSSLILSTSVALKRRSFARTLQTSSIGEPAHGAADFALQAALTGRYDHARRFIPAKRRCLLDSLALRAFLRFEGQRVQLVFGVAAAPFAAHCWLQNREAILNDSIDLVSRFTPIFAL